MAGHGPAHHAPRGEVDHGGQVEPALPGADVGEVGAPQPVDLDGAGAEAALDETHGGRRRTRIGDGGAPKPSLAAPRDAVMAHEPHHPLAPARLAVVTQLRMNPRGSIGAAASGVNGFDLGE